MDILIKTLVGSSRVLARVLPLPHPGYTLPVSSWRLPLLPYPLLLLSLPPSLVKTIAIMIIVIAYFKDLRFMLFIIVLSLEFSHSLLIFANLIADLY